MELPEINHPRPQTDVELAVKAKQDAKEAERTKKLQNLVTRTLWTFIMIGGFMGKVPHPSLTILDFIR